MFRNEPEVVRQAKSIQINYLPHIRAVVAINLKQEGNVVSYFAEIRYLNLLARALSLCT